MISTFVNFRRETIVEILNYDKEKFERELKTLNNKILFALNIDKIVKIIKENDSRALIKSQIIKAFPKSNLDDNDAEIIIETKLIQIKDLKNLESEKLKKEKEINKINTIL
jgi:DNA gyrase/topoisomerase IV subunit A